MINIVLMFLGQELPGFSSLINTPSTICRCEVSTEATRGSEDHVASATTAAGANANNRKSSEVPETGRTKKEINTSTLPKTQIFLEFAFQNVILTVQRVAGGLEGCVC